MAEEIGCEKTLGGLVETPIRQSDTLVDGLQVTLEIKEVRPVPRQESGVTMGLRQAHLHMHISKVFESSLALIVEFGERCNKTIALSGR